MYIEDVLDRAVKMCRGMKVMRDCGFPGGEFAWEECYLAFRKARDARPDNGTTPEYEQLKEQACLRLAIYLATFGMYRGSSFISGLDASAHMPMVELLLEKYDELAEFPGTSSADGGSMPDSEWNEALFSLVDEMRAYYGKVKSQALLFKEFYKGFPGQLAEEAMKECESIKADEPVDADKAGVSRVLITKILMGAFGSVPAYDRYFCAAAKECGLPQTFSERSFPKSCDFVRDNWSDVERTTKEVKFLTAEGAGLGLYYPPMRVIDKGMWCLGLEVENSGVRRGANCLTPFAVAMSGSKCMITRS